MAYILNVVRRNYLSGISSDVVLSIAMRYKQTINVYVHGSSLVSVGSRELEVTGGKVQHGYQVIYRAEATCLSFHGRKDAI